MKGCVQQMTDLEMKVEALIRCVGPEAVAQAMRKIRIEAPPDLHQPKGKPTVQQIQRAAHEILTDLGMPAHLVGYRYCATALVLVIEKPEYLKTLTKGLFPAVAQKYGISWTQVSRAIRHAVECVWIRGDPGFLERCWGSSVKPYMGRPTNGEFLSKCAELLRDDLGIEDV